MNPPPKKKFERLSKQCRKAVLLKLSITFNTLRVNVVALPCSTNVYGTNGIKATVRRKQEVAKKMRN